MKRILKHIALPLTFLTVLLVMSWTPDALPEQKDNGSGLSESDSVKKLLKEGKKLYVYKCGSCHFLYQPGKYTATEWIRFMPEMSAKAKLNTAQDSLILRYLTRNARKE